MNHTTTTLAALTLACSLLSRLWPRTTPTTPAMAGLHRLRPQHRHPHPWQPQPPMR